MSGGRNDHEHREEQGVQQDARPATPQSVPELLTLADQIERALARPPVGLILIGWEPPGDGSDPYDHQVDRSIVFSATTCARQTDIITGATGDRLAVVRAQLDAPAATEGLAHRIAQRLDTELELVAAAADRERVDWSIGVAVSQSGDRAVQLLRYADAALEDAWDRGGGQVVVFDDADRRLLDPALDSD